MGRSGIEGTEEETEGLENDPRGLGRSDQNKSGRGRAYLCLPSIFHEILLLGKGGGRVTRTKPRQQGSLPQTRERVSPRREKQHVEMRKKRERPLL